MLWICAISCYSNIYAKDKIGLFVCINLNQICNSDKNFYFFFRMKYILNYSSVKHISSASDICFSSPTKQTWKKNHTFKNGYSKMAKDTKTERVISPFRQSYWGGKIQQSQLNPKMLWLEEQFVSSLHSITLNNKHIHSIQYIGGIFVRPTTTQNSFDIWTASESL